MSDFERQKEQAYHLTQQKPAIFVVAKTPRSAATFSLICAFILSNQKVVIVTHSNRLSEEIRRKIPELIDDKARITVIPDNVRLCHKLNPTLKLRFQFKKSCKFCEHNKNPSKCLYWKILLEDSNVIVLTYQKLESLLLTKSLLLDKIQSYKNVILDEVGTRILSNPPKILLVKKENDKAIKASELIREKFHIEIEEYEKILREASYFERRKDALAAKFWSIMENTIFRIENIESSGKHQIRTDENVSSKDVKDLWRYITRLTETGKDTTLLQEYFPLMLSKDVFVSINNGDIYAAPLQDTLKHLREFCSMLEDGLVFLVDAFLPQGLDYNRILGKKVTPILWRDFNKTDEQQIILCDRSHLNKKYFLKSRMLQDRTENTIRSFNFDPEETLIVCLSKDVEKVVKSWMVGQTTWHRSSQTRGIQAAGKSKMFVVIGPFVPRDSFDSLAYSMSDEYFLGNISSDQATDSKKSLILKQNHEAGEFWNSIARIKDPMGRNRSLVVTIGLTKNDIEAFQQTEMPEDWPMISRPKYIQPVAKGGLSKDGPWIARLWFDRANVEVEDLPIVARVIRYAKQEKRVSLSQVFTFNKDQFRRIVVKYCDVLKRYGIRVDQVSGGLSFEAI
jgi:hypothetical protein